MKKLKWARLGYKNQNKGFTLIEMIVSLGVFTFVILIALSSFLAVLAAQRKAAAIGNVQENLRFAVEMMLKDIRVGTSYYCADTIDSFGNGGDERDCPNGGSTLTFKTRQETHTAENTIVVYRLNNGRIEKYSGDISKPVDESGFNVLTFSEIKIDSLKFYVMGTAVPGDTVQPKVIITMKGSMGITKSSFSTFNIETAVSQRKLDN